MAGYFLITLVILEVLNVCSGKLRKFISEYKKLKKNIKGLKKIKNI